MGSKYSLHSKPQDILQGSSIAHFVINKDHVIVEWNKACEVLTGFPAEKMLGTRNHWMPFYSFQRPCLADLLIDHSRSRIILKYYKGMHVKKWDLVEGAYEVEGFLAPLGKQGKWLRFTAAPLADVIILSISGGFGKGRRPGVPCTAGSRVQCSTRSRQRQRRLRRHGPD